MDIFLLQKERPYWQETMHLAETCSWTGPGQHLAWMMREYQFLPWEAVFAAVENGEPVGFCTFLKEDYYPENRYSPWISTIFVHEKARGRRLSHQLIDAAIRHAQAKGFRRVYIPSDLIGFYEKCGFVPIDTLQNYAGDTDTIFARHI